jgi:hypothetical protein
LVSNSDARLKREVRTIEGALKTLAGIEGKTYRWKRNLGRDDRTQYGLIAQEVERVVPELVHAPDDDAIRSVNYQGLIPMLIEAVHQLEEQCRQRDELLKLLRRQSALQEDILQKLRTEERTTNPQSR